MLRSRQPSSPALMANRDAYRILIPQKALARAKTRLRAVLGPEDRVWLTVQLLRRALAVCRQLTDATGVVVVGPAEVEPLAREFGAQLSPGGMAGMRRDVTATARRPCPRGECALLVVSSDLPLVNESDLRRVVEQWRLGYQLVLAPDRRRRGTNVMLVDRPEVFPFAFGGALGQGSFETHFSQAVGTGVSVQVLELPALALDLDLPADLAAFVRQAPDDPLAQYCLAHARESFLNEAPSA